MMKLSADGYLFEFEPDVVDAFVFDDPTHNVVRNTMKSVDIIAEFPNDFLFIELKKYHNNRGGIGFRCPLWDDMSVVENCPLALDERKKDPASVKRIARDLRQKYCDTFLYRFAENKVNKSISFICVVEGCDSALTLRLNDILSQSIPKGIPGNSSWIRAILKNVAVVTVNGWNATVQLRRFGTCKLV